MQILPAGLEEDDFTVNLHDEPLLLIRYFFFRGIVFVTGTKLALLCIRTLMTPLLRETYSKDKFNFYYVLGTE